MAVIVLLGGGHASGKHTAERMIAQEIKSRNLASVTTIDMDDYKLPGQAYTPEVYDFKSIIERLDSMKGHQVVIVVGLYALFDRTMREKSHIRVFIDADLDTRLIRWIRRDVEKASLELIIDQYLGGARQEMNDFIYPTKAYADAVMPKGPETSSVALVVDGIEPLLQHAVPVARFGRMLRPAANKFDEEKGQYSELN